MVSKDHVLDLEVSHIPILEMLQKWYGMVHGGQYVHDLRGGIPLYSKALVRVLANDTLHDQVPQQWETAVKAYFRALLDKHTPLQMLWDLYDNPARLLRPDSAIRVMRLLISTSCVYVVQNINSSQWDAP